MNPFCSECYNREECWIMSPYDCIDYQSFDEYIEQSREEFRGEFWAYLYSFEND